MKTRRAGGWRWAGAGLLLVFCGVATVLGIVFRTETGLRWLAGQISIALSTESHFVKVEGIRVAWLANWTVARVTVADPEGTWLELRDAECQWSPRALLDDQVAVSVLRMGALDVMRLPAGKGETPAKTSAPVLPEFAVEVVEIGRLRLGSSVLGFPLKVSGVRGRVDGGEKGDALRIGIKAAAANTVLAKVVVPPLAAEAELLLANHDWGFSGSLAGEGFHFSGELGFPGAGSWPTGHFRAEVDGSTGWAGHLRPGLSIGRITGSWDCPLRQDGAEAAEIHLSVAGVQMGGTGIRTAAIQARAQRKSAPPDLAIEADAHVEYFTAGDLTVTNAHLHVEGPWGSVALSGRAGGSLIQPFRLEAAGRLQWESDGQTLKLDQAVATWAGAQAQLTAPLQIHAKGEGASIRGAAEIASFDLSSISHAGWEMLEGQVAGNVQVGGTLAAPEFEGEVSCERVAIRAEKGDGAPSINGSLRFFSSNGALRVEAEAQAGKNGTAQLKARVPVRMSLVPWALQVDDNNPLSADLRSEVNLDGPVAIAGWSAPWAGSGRVAAELKVAGTPAAPEFEGQVSCEQVSLRTGKQASLPPMDGECRFSGSNGVLLVSAEAHMDTYGAEAFVKAQVPVRISLAPWQWHLDREGDFPADFRAGLDLALLNEAEFFATSRIGGRVDCSVAHTGPLSTGAVSGTCLLAGGEYENYAWGTVLREVQVLLKGDGEALTMESGSATDGGKGRVALSGRIRPAISEGLPYELVIDLRRARLLRRPDAEATVSGTVTLAGTLSQLRARGDVKVDNAVVDLRNLRPSPPAELESTRATPAVSEAEPRSLDFLSMRLAVDIPGTLYVRGRMLDSAWAGNLVLGHDQGESSLSGHLEPRRGTILLLKRPFKLEEGRLDFDGRWPPDPMLRLTAVFRRADLSARARIIGSTRDPEITLTSEPPLPEDEILSQILFGGDLQSLTPLQAISLAKEASALGRIGGGAGVLGDVQAAMGIDRVEFRENGQDAAAPEVAVGKYLGDRSYVEMRRATTIESSERSSLFLEHELWPNIVLEAESGQEMRSGVGLFWKRDY